MNEPLAQLYYTWAELDVLAGLVDERIARVEAGVTTGNTVDGGWPMLNSLRTSLREAQYTVERLT